MIEWISEDVIVVYWNVLSFVSVSELLVVKTAELFKALISNTSSAGSKCFLEELLQIIQLLFPGVLKDLRLCIICRNSLLWWMLCSKLFSFRDCHQHFEKFLWPYIIVTTPMNKLVPWILTFEWRFRSLEFMIMIVTIQSYAYVEVHFSCSSVRPVHILVVAYLGELSIVQVQQNPVIVRSVHTIQERP